MLRHWSWGTEGGEPKKTAVDLQGSVDLYIWPQGTCARFAYGELQVISLGNIQDISIAEQVGGDLA